MCFLQKNLWNQKKANNSNNNVVRVYGDVIHTGQRLLGRFYDAFTQTGNFKTIRTIPESIMEDLKLRNDVDIKNDEYK